MVASLRHRGPDDRGSGWELESGLAFGHRRLAVQDLSTAGRQPLLSRDQRYLLIYNGEIYNAPQLRRELEQEGCSFRGTSDTEVLLECIARRGLQATLPSLQGMYAFALWDRRDKKLTLARDRVGIKPLYYGNRGGALLFASELKALTPFPGFTSELDPAAVTEYFQLGYVPAPRSIERGIHKLPPGTTVTFTAANSDPVPLSYWSLETIVRSAHAEPFETNEAVALHDLEKLLTTSIKERLIADVPVGAFLSGGIDSSLVVALMQQVHGSPVKTFSIGFQEPEYNEAEYARAIARHLGTKHQEMIVDSSAALQVIPQLAATYDEPFGDASQIPTMLLSHLARQEVTVALSGDGGDELFAGYRRYPHFAQRWAQINRFSPAVRSGLRGLLKLTRTLPISARLKDAAQARIEVSHMKSFRDYYERFNRHWKHPALILKPEFFSEQDNHLADPGFTVNEDGWIDWMRYQDLHRYLPDDILTKVDRASMAHSLEVRVPLLDHRVVEWSWTLPPQFKQGAWRDENTQQGKVLLRKLLQKFVSRDLFERPKIGFGVPLDHWLRGPLKEWAGDRLSGDALEASGILNPPLIRQRWEEHLSGQADWQYLLWDVLMFQEFLANR